MSLVFMSSTDYAATEAHLDTLWTNAQKSPQTNGVGTGRSVMSTGAGDELRIDLTDSQTIVVHFMLIATNVGGGNQFIEYLRIQSDATVQVALYYSPPLERFAVYLGSTKHAEATKRTQIHKGWRHMSLKVVRGNFGSYELRENNVVIASATNVDTDQANSGKLNRVTITGVGGTFFDSIVILNETGTLNNDFLGNVHIWKTVPDAAGDSTQWTPSSGSNFSAVDEATPSGGTDYVEATTDGLKDLYGMTDQSNIGSIAGLQVVAYCQDTASASDGIIIRMKSSTTDAAGPKGAQVAPQGVYGYRWDVFETDPATSAAWANITAVNSAQVGIEADI